jgi:hypothetical protein
MRSVVSDGPANAFPTFKTTTEQPVRSVCASLSPGMPGRRQHVPGCGRDLVFVSLTHVPLSCRYRCAAIRLPRIAPVPSNPPRAEATPLYQSRRLPSSRWRGTPQTSGDNVLHLQLSCLSCAVSRSVPGDDACFGLFGTAFRRTGRRIPPPFLFREQEGPLTPYGKLYVCPGLIPRPAPKLASRY